MSTEIKVPTLGESVTEATIGQWFKKVGDSVAQDETIAELETDKVTIEVPAPAEIFRPIEASAPTAFTPLEVLKPVEAVSIDAAKPIEAKPVEAKPVEAKPVEASAAVEAPVVAEVRVVLPQGADVPLPLPRPPPPTPRDAPCACRTAP